MLFRRRSKKTELISRAAFTTCERLESRQFLTAVVNGVFSGTNTQYEGQQHFDYVQGNGNVRVRISVTGNLTAEFIGGRVAAGGSSVILEDLVPFNGAGSVSSDFLFSIYVVSADANCSISIAQVGGTDPTAFMDPFTAGQPIRVNSASANPDATVLPTTIVTPPDGGVYIGAKTLNNDPAPFNSIPVIFAGQSAFGMRPSSAGQLIAGLEVAPGNSLNKVFIGGTISGAVNIKKGNIDTFYAGNVLTGNTDGINAYGTSSIPNNFHVGGDIRNLISANSFGTISLSTPQAGTVNDLSRVLYKTGFQLKVDGRLGEMFANNAFLGQVSIRHDDNIKGPGTVQSEYEVRGAPFAVNNTASYFDAEILGNDIGLGNKTLDARFFNDTFDTAQWLGTAYNSTLKNSNAIVLNGSLGNRDTTASTDFIDFYAVALMAGQSIDVQMIDKAVQNQERRFHLRVGIFDPAGRLIATDFTNGKDQFARIDQPIRIKATIPGSYRIAVADFNDPGFTGAGSFVLFNHPYELRINNAGDIALGGMIANQHIATMDRVQGGLPSVAVQVLNGDLGEVRAGLGTADNGRAVNPAQGVGAIWSTSGRWAVQNGNLRSMEASNIGLALLTGVDDPFQISGPDLFIKKGSVGLLHSTGVAATSILEINDDTPEVHSDLFELNRGFIFDKIYPTPADDLSLTDPTLAVGKNIQLIDCGGTIDGAFLTNGGIGVIRTQNLGGQRPDATPVIQVNVDGVGNDGIIDLIDVTGTVNAPALTTGPNGDLRYFHVATASQVVQDSFFGGGIQQGIAYAPGEEAVITDDSGVQMTLTPTPRVLSTLFPLPVNATTPFLDPAQLFVLSYGIRDKAGVAVMRVNVLQVDDINSDGLTNIIRPGGGGVSIQTSGGGTNAGAEIGEINVSTSPALGGLAATASTGTSNPFTFNPFTGTNAGIPARSYQQNVPPVAPAQPIRPLDMLFEGSARIDIFDIVSGAAQIINSIANETKGEIVNMTGGSDVFDMEAQTIGVPKVSSTGTRVEGALIRSNVFPFVNSRTLVNLQDVASIRARGAIGNIQATNMGTLSANSDGKDDPKIFEGVAAPIFINGGAANNTSNLVSARVGEGIAFSGTGTTPLAGLYSAGLIDSVRSNGDIRGAIVVTGLTTRTTQQAVDINNVALTNPDGTPLRVSTPTFNIGSVSVNGGSIIEGDIMAISALTGSLENTVPAAAPEQADNSTDPFFDIGSVRVSGKGGIIGMTLVAADIGTVKVDGGFGVFSSFFLTTGDQVVQGISADGYGIRNTDINGAAFIRSIVATGNGKTVPVTTFNSSVRQSQTGASFDPASGLTLSSYNDLHVYLGTTKSHPTRSGYTETGQIADSRFRANRDLGKIEADSIQANNTTRLIDATNGTKEKIPLGDVDWPMQINFANSAGSIVVHHTVSGLSLRASKLNLLSVGGDFKNSQMISTNVIKTINLGSFSGASIIKTQGSNGNIGNINIKKSLNGAIDVSGDVTTIKVGTDLGSPHIRINGNLRTLNVLGSVVTDANIKVDKTIFNLLVGQDVRAGAIITADAIKKQKIGGQVEGDILIV